MTTTCFVVELVKFRVLCLEFSNLILSLTKRTDRDCLNIPSKGPSNVLWIDYNNSRQAYQCLGFNVILAHTVKENEQFQISRASSKLSSSSILLRFVRIRFRRN